MTDDKFIHVFEITEAGELKDLSQRCMPKRPCAIQILPDNATIIVGDKFGDVYSLPVIPSNSLPVLPSEAASTQDVAAHAETDAETKKDDASFKPSATVLTVHSKRNRMALEAQMQQKNFTAKKEPLKFEHKLLLGHVSMLTDVVSATHKVDGKQRDHIITADRDEHVRISRGPPQSHIIEDFCLGHTEFVSKLCLIPGTDMLVSGGGDDWLGIWDWPTFTLRRKLDLKYGVMDEIMEVADSRAASGLEDRAEVLRTADRSVVVSGLWTAPFTNSKGKHEKALLIACERRPWLLIIPVSRLKLKKDNQMTRYTLDFPVLDVACVGETVVISLDGRSDDSHRFQCVKLSQNEESHKAEVLEEIDDEMETKLKCLKPSSDDLQADDKPLDELLYGVANLRKRRGWDAPGDGGGDAQGDADSPVLDPNATEVVDSSTQLDPNATQVAEVEDDLTVRKL